MEERNEIKKIEDDLGEALIDERLSDLNETFADSAWDLATKDSPISDIPVVGTLVKSIKLIGGIKEYYFTKRLLTFLVGIKKVSQEKREKFRREMEDKGQFDKVKEHLITLIDKLDDAEKAELIAKIFIEVLEDKLTYEGFRQYANIVSNSFLYDLKTLKGHREGDVYKGHSGNVLLGLGLVDIAPIEMERTSEGLNDEGYERRDYRESFKPKNLEKAHHPSRDDFHLRVRFQVNEYGQDLYDVLFGEK